MSNDGTLDAATRASGTRFFFVLTLALTFSLQLPAVLTKLGVIAGPIERYMLLGGLAGFAPLVAAIAASFRESGRSGIRALFAPSAMHRMAAPWFFIAIVAFPVIHVAGVATLAAVGLDHGRWLYPPENAQHVAAMLIFPVAEEPGWRGFALPRLQAHMTPLRASLVVGALWAFWHAMMFVLQGMTPTMFAVATINIISGSIVFSWLYSRTSGSLLIAILAHLGVHLNNPTHALPNDPMPFFVYTASICVAAVALLVGDRAAWRASRPRT